MIKLKKILKKVLREFTGTNVGTGLNIGDSWPDGLFTKYGEKRRITPGGMPRGMVQLEAPAADSPYGGDGSQREMPPFVKRTKITPEYLKSQEVLNPHDLRDDTPPLNPKQRVYGRRPFGKSPDYIIPRESADFVTSTKNQLVRPTTPPEGSESGGIEATPEKGSKKAGSKSGYKQLQKGGENLVKGIDKLYIYKMLQQEGASLPTKVKDMLKKKVRTLKPNPDDELAKDFLDHHRVHSGPHMDGVPAEDDTYDWDDGDGKEGGIQKEKDKKKKGYEPVRERIKLTDLLKEGVYDKGILKAVFMAGGPGSGKSYMARGIFGIPTTVAMTSVYGLKTVNSDTEFEYYLRKFGFDTAGSGYGKGNLDLEKWPKEVWDMVGGDQSDKDAKENPNLRAMTKKYTQMRKDGYMNGRLGMIIDGTARDVNKIKKEKKELESLGYDCYMVFVNTTLPVAQARNKVRARRLPPKLLEKSWKQVQANIGKFNGLFSGRFLIVDNSKTMDEDAATKKFNMLIKKGIGKFISKPIKNPIGKQWIKNQLVLKKKGLK